MKLRTPLSVVLALTALGCSSWPQLSTALSTDPSTLVQIVDTTDTVALSKAVGSLLLT